MICLHSTEIGDKMSSCNVFTTAEKHYDGVLLIGGICHRQIFSVYYRSAQEHCVDSNSPLQ